MNHSTKPKTCTRKKSKAILSVFLIVAILIAGAFAFLSATDSKTNVFTVGNIKIELWEKFDTNLNGTLDDNEIYDSTATEVSIDADKSIIPGQTILKQPMIKNTGKNPAYLYMAVGVPTATEDNIKSNNLGDKVNIVVKAFGIQENYKNKTTATDIWNAYFDAAKATSVLSASVENTEAELFTLNKTVDSGWSEISTYRVDGYVYHIFALDNAMGTAGLVDGYSTSPFESVTFNESVEVGENGHSFQFAPNLSWREEVINTTTGEITSGDNKYLLNNYLSPIYYAKNMEITLNDNIMMKIAYYDSYGNFISCDGWKSKTATQYSTIQDSFSITDSYFRIAIADVNLNDLNQYTITSEELSSRFKCLVSLPFYTICNNLQAIQSIKLPDAQFSANGLGFTCTGLTYDKNESIFYVGNYGKMKPTDSETHHSIVKLSKDCSNIIDEINLSNISNINDVQGVAIDTATNTLWVVSQLDKAIYNIEKNGTLIQSIPYDKEITGVAYSSKTDSLWIVSNGCLENINKSGNVLRSVTFDSSIVVDQLYIDEINNHIYITADVSKNYQSSNYVYRINLTNNCCELYYILDDTYAIEGISIVDNCMYIATDGYYHNAKTPLNEIKIYSII